MEYFQSSGLAAERMCHQHLAGYGVAHPSEIGVYLPISAGAAARRRPARARIMPTQEVQMKALAYVLLLAVASLPLVGQTHNDDRNLRRTRKDVSTVSAPEVRSGGKDANAQLERLEQQTARLAAQPAAKTTTPMPKLPSSTDRPSAGSQQSMPVHAQSSGLKSGARNYGHSSRGAHAGKANPYPH